MRLSARDLSCARSVTTYRPGVRNRAAGIQLRENVLHDAVSTTAKVRWADSARALLSRSITVMRPVRSSQTRKRAKTRTPTRFSDRNTIVGALFPGTVTVVEFVVVSVTVPVGIRLVVLETAVAAPPPEVCAVTSARSLWPTAASRTPYVRPVAPAMFTQFAPAVSQRCHWRVNEVGVGLQLPFETVSSPPTIAVPVTVGLTVFVAPLFDATTSLASEGAAVLPSAFTAVTITRTVCPTSPVTSVYVFSVALVRSPHPVPALLQ